MIYEPNFVILLCYIGDADERCSEVRTAVAVTIQAGKQYEMEGPLVKKVMLLAPLETEGFRAKTIAQHLYVSYAAIRSWKAGNPVPSVAHLEVRKRLCRSTLPHH